MSGNAGAKREWIVIKSMIETTDSEGNPVKSWATTVTSMWARVKSLTGREFESVKSINSEIAKKFEVPYRTDLTVLMRVEWNGSNWNIHDIQPTEDKFDMALYASRVQ